MKRTADYTIEGFLYQFNKTLLEILVATDETRITVEGIIEDIDVSSPDGLCAIQCKYHESQQEFSLSAIYKPILEMMKHYVSSPELCVNYRLYAYFPNEMGCRKLNKEELEAVLSSKNKDLQSLIKEVEGKIDVEKFSENLIVEFGKSIDELEKSVHAELVKAGLPKGEIETLIYPNAINEIATTSTRHNIEERITTRQALIETLKKIRKTAITRWTLSLRSYKKILDAKRKQLKSNLSKNARLRYFILSKDFIRDFKEEVVNFIQEYLEKYHFKDSHISTPLFCLDCASDEYTEIRVRMHKKGIRFNDGVVAETYFDKKHFLRDPLVSKQKGFDPKVEFRLRIMRLDESFHELLGEKVCDDLFVVSSKLFELSDITDVNVESLGFDNFQEIKFVLGMSDIYE